MYEWNETVQKIIDWIENNITENITLLEMSKQIGYSPYYCSVMFHKIYGTSFKSYVAGRRLTLAAFEIRDTSDRIMDIALKYGFSSQEALTRAFRSMFGCTPAAYRKNPIPIPFKVSHTVFMPQHYYELYKGEIGMSTNNLTKARVRVEFIPAHKYIGIWDDNSTDYCSFFDNHDCDKVCGTIDSLNNICHPIITGHTAGWYYSNDKRHYFYGVGMPLDYSGKVPQGFDIKEFPGSYYLVFYHPPFDYLKDNDEVMQKVETLAWNYDIDKEHKGKYQWNEEKCQCYQRHYPEGIGYEILRPIKLK